MEERQLAWRWARARRPDPPAPPPAAPRKPSPAAAYPSLAEDLRDLERFVDEVGGGRIGPVRVEGARVTVAMRAADGELYHLRIATRDHPTRPPSCTFVDAEGRESPAAWPAYDTAGPFRPPVFICTPPTAEFYEYHSECRYDPGAGSLVDTVGTIFTALNGRGYSGRNDGRREWTRGMPRRRRER